ncbi:MAG: NAD(P)H-dependent oxidoreductase [Acidimicrobiia bacterium]|jgi:chromate reductase, NAD(P)H dehydrogenase (quinone)
MPTPVHIAAISGSLRRGSYNSALVREAASRLPEAATMEILPIRDLPFFDADLEAAGSPDSVRRFRAGLAGADALLIATPEYNYSVTAALKNAIDWASRGPASPLDGKPAAIMGAGGRLGTARAQLHLREILMHNRVHVLPGPEILVAGASAQFDEHLRLRDPMLGERIGHLVAELVVFTIRHRLAAPLGAAG